ncbi:MAG: Asp23/Gls24 family envelope stress response protein [Clostridia bacterium]|nr:Asp23/Gls24 family envelope stress response protein [Clostridia bacterium]
MANRKQKLVDTEEGSVSYKRNVVLSIVKLASQEINGIASLSTDAFSMWKKMFNKNYNRGVLIEFGEDDDVYVDVYVNVLFGYSVKDVAFRVQENIKSSIESMTDFKVAAINVNVTGVVFGNNEEMTVV